MRAVSLWLYLHLGVGLLAGEEVDRLPGQVRVTRADPLVRPGLIYRSTIEATALSSPGPFFLTVALVADDQVLAVSELPIATAGQLAAGIGVTLVPVRASSDVAPVLRARISDQRHRLLARTTRVLGDRLALINRASLAVAHLRATAITAPLPWLLAEQAAEWVAPQRLPTIADDQALRRTVEQLEAWRVDAAEKPGPGTHLLAYRDPVDASVQPIRLTVPPGFSSGAAVISLVVLLRSTGPGKAQWQALPAAWSAAALAAGVAVLEVQSAGDGSWSGAALRRLPLAEAAARAAVPALSPTPLMMLAHPGLDQPSAWQRPGPVTVPFPKSPLTPTGQSEGQLTVWSTGPFVVVVGTGEHRSAAEDAAQLADAFVAAWAAHARGLPPRIDDTAWRAADWRGYHVILVGTPRGNRVIRELVPEGPLSWDDRTVRAEGLSYHRSLHPGVALTMSYPGDPTRSLMILDGRPAWSEPPGALPFSSIKDRSWLLIPPRP